MKVKLSNFGPVNEFSIDLDKDFHLLLGPNNVGKSYALTAVYLILKSFIEMYQNFMGFRGLLDLDISDAFKEDARKIIELTKESKQVVITDIFKKSFIYTLQKTLIDPMSDSLVSTFSSLDNLHNRFSDEKFSIELSCDDFLLILCAEKGKLIISSISLYDVYFVKKVKRNLDLKKEAGKVTIYLCEDKLDEFVARYTISVINRVLNLTARDIARKISSIHYLPASRSGLYQALSAFGQIIAQLSKNRSFLSKKIELPGISEPVSDYFIKLSDIRATKKQYEDKPINLVASKIESEILNGRIEFNPQTKQLMFFPSGTKLELELSSTSSMVSELAPIVSYLRYILTQPRYQSKRSTSLLVAKSLIMIEEPEAHLHPEIQVKLTEIFSDLIGLNVKIIMTSHSNYVFNKVNNLIMDSKLDHKVVNSTIFEMTDSGSKTVIQNVDELGIEDENFIKVTEKLFNDKMDIIDRVNEQGGHDFD